MTWLPRQLRSIAPVSVESSGNKEEITVRVLFREAERERCMRRERSLLPSIRQALVYRILWEELRCTSADLHRILPSETEDRGVGVPDSSKLGERAGEGIRGPEQSADRDFNNKLDIIKAEVQMQFRKIMAEEVTKMTAQLTEELSQAREQLTRACRELEDTRLQLQAMKEAQEVPLASPDVHLLPVFRPRPPLQAEWRRQSQRSARLT